MLFTHAVAQLPPKCQQVFILRKVEGLSMKDIAIRMDISVSAVEKHVATGLIKCCDFFRAKGYDPAELGPIAEQYAQQVPDSKLRATRSEDG